MALTRIIAVVIDITRLTAYRPDGSTIEVPQGDPRVFVLLDALPLIEKQGYAMVELSRDNPYKAFEQKSGIVRFFRVAKQKVAHIFGGTERQPIAPVGIVGKVPVMEEKLPEQRPYSHADAIADIMAHAESVSSDNFSPDTMAETDTIVAVTEDAIIPHAEQLEDQLRHSAKVGTTKGIEAFYKRISKVIHKRRHSIEDLLRFMEKNDLPIADDGSLIVYKVLRKREGIYYDCHTGKVPQKIGSFVCMDESLVDPNRSRECSNGLHVARRGYIGGFSGDACTIVKVAPENVIAVPHGDADKVRVCGYHLLMELPNDAWNKLKQNVPMTDNEKCQKMLGRAMSGDHVAVLEIVKIGGPKGTKISVTPVRTVKKADKPVEVRKAVSVDDRSVKPLDQPVDKAKVSKQLTDIVKTSSSRQAQAATLIDVIETSGDASHRFKAALELLNLKRTAKVSWATLGLSDEQAKKALDIKIMGDASAQDHTAHVVENEVEVAISTDTPEPEVVAETPVTPSVNSRRAQISLLADTVLDHNTSTEGRVKAARELLDYRRKVKKSWEKLGRPDITDQYLRTIVNSNIAVAPPKKIPSRSKGSVVASVAAKTPAKKPMSRIEKARDYYNRKRWVDLTQLKRKSRMSWEKLGFSQVEITQIKLHSGD